MNKQFFGIIILVIAALVGIFALTGDKKNETSNSSGNNAAGAATDHTVKPLAPAATPENPNPVAPVSTVTLVEYGDFQCPACKSYYPLVNQLKTEFKDTVNFQFRHFPLVQIHPNAFIGSRAAEAAGIQGKFFEMHDLLYENQDTWSTASNPQSYFEAYAKQLNLDIEKFKTDSASSAVADAINADVKAGQALKANSTPTFILNGKKIEKNPQSADEFKKLLDDAVAAAKK